MVSTSLSSNKKRKIGNEPTIISHKDSCRSLNSPPRVACECCAKKNEQEITKCQSRHHHIRTSFRHISKFKCCEKGWSDEYVIIPNVTQGLLNHHSDMCVYLCIEPKVDLTDGFID